MVKTKAMYSLIEEYNTSGVSAIKFAASKGIKLSTFRYWISKKRSLERKATHCNFIEVGSGAFMASAPGLQIVYPNGVRIVSSSFDLHQIQQLVKLY